MQSTWRRIREYPWGLFFLVGTAFGFLLFFYKAFDGLAREREVEWLVVFLEEMTGAYSTFSLVPLAAWLTLRHPIAGQVGRRLPLYMIAGICFSLLDTSIIYAVRLAIFQLAGLGVYDYGLMRYRYLMEMPMSLILFSMLVVAFSYAEERRAARDRESRVKALEGELVRSQLEMLRLQLQPHFLFNALNAISAAVHEDARAADRMIVRLSEFLRSVLRSDSAQESTLREEFDLLQLYLDVMKVRFEHKLRCEVWCGEELKDAMAPQLVLQPVVENAIRHGADPATGDIDITVEARRVGELLELVVSDGGVGFGKRESNGLGIGLKTIGSRLEKLYGADGGLTVENGGTGGARIRIRLPYHREPMTLGR